MKHLLKLSFLPIASLFLFIVGCEHKPKELINPGNTPKDSIVINPDPISNCDSAVAYFKNDILPIFTSSCVGTGCHNATDRAEGLVLTNYNNIKKLTDTQNPKGSDLWKVLVSTDPNKMMPRTQRLSASDRYKILKWMNQGAKNDSCNSGCDTAKYAYAADIAPIISKNCNGCHSTGATKLGTWAQLNIQAQNNNLWRDINLTSGPNKMPPAASLSVCDKNKIQKWINAGAPNN
ncbi:MAG: hypothetical protein PSX81_02375 [bacterium]|nr:hypothetical protein [bacterium]